jgi:hypothetical protein
LTIKSGSKFFEAIEKKKADIQTTAGPRRT